MSSYTPFPTGSGSAERNSFIVILVSGAWSTSEKLFKKKKKVIVFKKYIEELDLKRPTWMSSP